MKIVVITGSHHKNGTSAHLAAAFIRGAEETGHEVCRFDAAFRQVHPCIACETCHNTDRGCAFATPIYYYAMNAQIRAVIDRFYACDAQLHHNKKTALLVTMADNTMESAAGAIASFQGMAKFLDWDIAGMVIGADCMDVPALERTDYEEQAYQLGKQI